MAYVLDEQLDEWCLVFVKLLNCMASCTVSKEPNRSRLQTKASLTRWFIYGLKRPEKVNACSQYEYYCHEEWRL